MNQSQRQPSANLLYLDQHRLAKRQGKSLGSEDNNTADADENWQACLTKVAATADKLAFQQLYLHFAPRIKHFYMQNTPRPQAEEMTHEVFIKVWQKAGTYDPAYAKVSTWLFTIARNVRIDKLRKKKVQVTDDDVSEVQPKVEQNQLESGKDEMMDELSTSRKSSAIRRLMPTLNDEQRQVIQKVYFEDKSHQIAAEELDMTLGTVKSRVRSALKLLRNQMNEFSENGDSHES